MTHNEQSGLDVEKEIELAWSDYECELSGRFAALADEHSTIVQVQGPDPEGTYPYVQLLAFAEGEALRCEVSADHFLSTDARLGDAGAELFDALGFSPPGDAEADDPN